MKYLSHKQLPTIHKADFTRTYKDKFKRKICYERLPYCDHISFTRLETSLKP